MALRLVEIWGFRLVERSFTTIIAFFQGTKEICNMHVGQLEERSAE